MFRFAPTGCLLILSLTALSCNKSPDTPPNTDISQTQATTTTTMNADDPAAVPQETDTTPAAETGSSDSAPSAPLATNATPLPDLPTPVTLDSEDWPQFRGPNRNGISTATGLRKSWSDYTPKIVWQQTVGQGYAAPTVVANRVYLNDYDESQNVWMVRCLTLDQGEELWRYGVKKKIRPNHAITRTAPSTDGAFVISIDPKCELHCLDARNGALLWKKQLSEEYKSQIPPWYNGQCPLLEGDRVVIATGGRVVLTALDKSTGKTVWETNNDQQIPLSHSSVMPVELEGVKQYTYTALNGLVGVDAASGQLLWHFPWKFNTAVTTTPLPLGNGNFLLTAGYHAETVICHIGLKDQQWVADKVVSLPPPTAGWNSELQTPIVHRDHIFGIGKKKRGLWTCLDLNAVEKWDSGGKASFGMGSYVLAEGMFFVLEDKTGTVRVLDAEADEYKELGNFTVLEGPDVWAPPVISHGKLLIRDLNKLVCLDIAAG